MSTHTTDEDLAADDPLGLLARCDGYYECPRDEGGRRLGPLVGYAGKYDAPDGSRKQYVGDVYANFAKLERRPSLLKLLPEHLFTVWKNHEALKELHSRGVRAYCGLPEGGKSLALAIAMQAGKEFIYPEKKVLEVAHSGGREVSQLVWGRHELEKGQNVVLVEDVCNNFSTTEDVVRMVKEAGAVPVAIMCFLNRSLKWDSFFRTEDGSAIPIVALVRKPILEYQQEDPAVLEDIAKGNVVWKPKHEWEKLMAAFPS